VRRVLLAGVMAGWIAEPLLAAQPPPAPAVEAVDVELLEFLGSLDTEEEDWRKYLEERPAQTAAGKPAAPPPAPREPPAKPVEVKKK
jgi:hypothetical protein